MTTQINADLSLPCSVATSEMEWSPSPSGTVWRKRVHLVGSAEAGQVTSVVRYDARSSFAAHEHPDGEEILVLDGVFSDEQGDWPAGTFLLNPEGFRHAPYSDNGCVLFVKLRQFPGTDRIHVAVDTKTLSWEPTTNSGVARKSLYSQDGYTDFMALERWNENSAIGTVSYPAGAEVFVVDGGFSDENGSYGAGHWLRFPVGSEHNPRTETGCILYVKRAGFAYLKSGSQ